MGLSTWTLLPLTSTGQFPYLSLLVFALCIRCSYVSCIHIYTCYKFFLDWSLDHYVMSFFVSCYSFCFKVYFAWYKYCYPNFFWFPFGWSTFFHQLTFCLCMTLDLKLVSYRQPIYGSCFCIHSAKLCVLIGAFRSSTFKVITDRYWHFVHCFGLVSVVHFCSFLFLCVIYYRFFCRRHAMHPSSTFPSGHQSHMF